MIAELIQVKKVYYLTVEEFVTSNPLLLNLRHMIDHLKRGHHMYIFSSEGFLHIENEKVCKDTLMNGHWEELVGKVKKFLYATDHPDKYHVHI